MTRPGAPPAASVHTRVAVLLLATLAACASPRLTRFRADEYAPYAGEGGGRIRGQISFVARSQQTVLNGMRSFEEHDAVRRSVTLRPARAGTSGE